MFAALTQGYCTREALFARMCNGEMVAVETTGGWKCGYITRIEKEDGSGYNFNVTIANRDGAAIVFMRCVRP